MAVTIAYFFNEHLSKDRKKEFFNEHISLKIERMVPRIAIFTTTTTILISVNKNFNILTLKGNMKTKVTRKIQEKCKKNKNQKSKSKWQNKALSSISKNNQNGISKSNTAPQIKRIMIIDRNSKEHPQNKYNQKELPQLKKYFSSFI